MKNKITAAAFLVMIAVFVAVLVLPSDKDSIAEENREMNAIPSLNSKTAFSGEFAEGFEGFIGDNIGFRSELKQFSGEIESFKGFPMSQGQIISTNKDIGTGTVQKQTLLVADNAIMEMFMKNANQEEAYAEAVNSYAKALNRDIKIFSMLIPTQLEFCEPIYKNLQDSQRDAIEAVYKKLDKRVKPIDVCTALESHSDEYIYFRTDHHWTQLGAYYAYRAFMESDGAAAVDKSDFEVNKIQSFLGSLADRVNVSEFAVPLDTIEWYDVNKSGSIRTRMYEVTESGRLRNYNGIMYDRTKKNYNFFFGCDHPVVVMTNSDNPAGKTLLVLKDSYTNALAPWLIKSYRSVILVDPRIYKGKLDTVLNAYSIDELLIVNYIFTTNFPDYCDLLKNLH